MPIPFWVILMSFTVAGILKLRRWPGVQIVLGMLAGLILIDGLVPSVRYIYGKTESPFSIHHYAQEEVAVSRFLKHVVAGKNTLSPSPGTQRVQPHQGLPILLTTHLSARGKLIRSSIYFCTITMTVKSYPFVRGGLFS